jgi:hypothetical protein
MSENSQVAPHDSESTRHVTPRKASNRKAFTTRRLVAMLATVLAIGGGATLTASPAEAAGESYRTYDIEKGDRCTVDMWVLTDAYGRARPYVWFDLNNDCKYDSLYRDGDGDGSFEELWLDHYNPGGGWDAFVLGNNLMYETQNGSGQYGSVTDSRYGLTWARMGWTSATVGGTSPSNATAAGAFWNLMTRLAAATGRPAY